MEELFQWVSHHYYSGIFTLLVLGIVGMPIPDESVLAFVGYLIYQGKLRFLPSIGSAMIGSICGISLSYGLGRTIGLFALHRYGRYLGITQDNIDLVHAWFKRAGRWTLVFGYFIPGVRHLTAFVAGSSKLELWVFATFAYAGGVIWSITFIVLGYFFGKGLSRMFVTVHHDLMIVLGLGTLVALLYFLIHQRYIQRIAKRR